MVMLRLHISLIIILFALSGYTAADAGDEGGPCFKRLKAFPSPTRLLTQPGYPNSYDKYLTCEWLISAPDGQSIQFNVIEVDLDDLSYRSCYRRDHVKLVDGGLRGEVLATLCTYDTGVYYTSQDTAIVKFKSNYAGKRGKGFKLEYSSGEHVYKQYTMLSLQAEEDVQSFYPPRVSYNNNRYIVASWTIRYKPDYSTGDNSGDNKGPLFIRVVKSSLANCGEFGCTDDCTEDDNYMEAFDGEDSNSPSLGRWCGEQLVEKEATGDSLYILLHAKQYNSEVAFQIEYGIEGVTSGLGIGGIAGICIGSLVAVGLVYVIGKIACSHYSERLDEDEDEFTAESRGGLMATGASTDGARGDRAGRGADVTHTTPTAPAPPGCFTAPPSDFTAPPRNFTAPPGDFTAPPPSYEEAMAIGVSGNV